MEICVRNLIGCGLDFKERQLKLQYVAWYFTLRNIILQLMPFHRVKQDFFLTILHCCLRCKLLLNIHGNLDWSAKSLQTSLQPFIIEKMFRINQIKVLSFFNYKNVDKQAEGK